MNFFENSLEDSNAFFYVLLVLVLPDLFMWMVCVCVCVCVRACVRACVHGAGRIKRGRGRGKREREEGEVNWKCMKQLSCRDNLAKNRNYTKTKA